MSLATPRKFSLGVICSRSFDDPSLLDNLLGAKVESIAHVYSTGALPGGKYIEEFARSNGIDFTVYPSSAHAMKSASRVVEVSEFVFVITDGTSKIATFAEAQCQEKEKSVPAFKWRAIKYDPFTHWRDIAANVSEILSAVPPADIEANETLKALVRVAK